MYKQGKDNVNTQYYYKKHKHEFKTYVSESSLEEITRRVRLALAGAMGVVDGDLSPYFDLASTDIRFHFADAARITSGMRFG